MKMNKKEVICVLLLIISFLGLKAQTYYYGIDNFGKLILHSDDTFSYKYFDCCTDSGTYIMNKDTLILNSLQQAITLSNINEYEDSVFYINDYCSHITLTKMEDECNIINLAVKHSLKRNICDTLYNASFKRNDWVQFVNFLYPNRAILWTSDTIRSATLNIYPKEGRRLYFDNYPMLIRDQYLMPFDLLANRHFYLHNNINLVPLEKGDENEEFLIYISGFSGEDSY